MKILSHFFSGISKFQGLLDSLKNTPLELTEIEKGNTLLAGLDTVRYQVAIFNFDLQPHLQGREDTTHVSRSTQP